MNFNRPLILASKSPRRQQLLKSLDLTFEIKTKDIDEDFPNNLHPQEVAKYLAEKKANAFKNDLTNEVLITADTVVVMGDKILGKPDNRNEAQSMLQSLSDSVHQVITGVCIASKSQQIVFDDVTKVHFKALTQQEIDYYIDHYQPYDKAGAYGIQEWIGMIGIDKIEGSYFNVVGLPLNLVHQHLEAFR